MMMTTMIMMKMMVNNIMTKVSHLSIGINMGKKSSSCEKCRHQGNAGDGDDDIQLEKEDEMAKAILGMIIEVDWLLPVEEQ